MTDKKQMSFYKPPFKLSFVISFFFSLKCNYQKFKSAARRLKFVFAFICFHILYKTVHKKLQLDYYLVESNKINCRPMFDKFK